MTQALFNKTLLLVEDDQTVVSIIKQQFADDKHIIILEATNEETARTIIRIKKPDLIILDQKLEKDSDSIEILKYVRNSDSLKSVGVIMLTSTKDSETISRAYDLQADEYITKPFSPYALKQRILRVLRRISPFLDDKITLDDGLIFNVSQRHVIINGYKIRISKTDHQIMILFCEKRGQIISREEIIEHVWENSDKVSIRTVDVHISRLRITLRNFSNIIQTVSGAGYKLLLQQPNNKINHGRPKKLSVNKLHLAEAMIKKTNLNKQEIADALGISISTLYSSLKL